MKFKDLLLAVKQNPDQYREYYTEDGNVILEKVLTKAGVPVDVGRNAYVIKDENFSGSKQQLLDLTRLQYQQDGNMIQLIFENCEFNHCDLSDSLLDGLSTVNGTVSDCKLDGSNLKNCDFSSVQYSSLKHTAISKSHFFSYGDNVMSGVQQDVKFTLVTDSEFRGTMKSCVLENTSDLQFTDTSLLTGCTIVGGIRNTFIGNQLLYTHIGQQRDAKLIDVISKQLRVTSLYNTTIEGGSHTIASISDPVSFNYVTMQDTEIEFPEYTQFSTWSNSEIDNSQFRPIRQKAEIVIDTAEGLRIKHLHISAIVINIKEPSNITIDSCFISQGTKVRFEKPPIRVDIINTTATENFQLDDPNTKPLMNDEKSYTLQNNNFTGGSLRLANAYLSKNSFDNVKIKATYTHILDLLAKNLNLILANGKMTGDIILQGKLILNLIKTSVSGDIDLSEVTEVNITSLTNIDMQWFRRAPGTKLNILGPLTDVHWPRAPLANAKFGGDWGTKPNLTRVNFADADGRGLDSSRWYNYEPRLFLLDCILHNMNLEDADLSGTRICNFDYCPVNYCDVKGDYVREGALVKGAKFPSSKDAMNCPTVWIWIGSIVGPILSIIIVICFLISYWNTLKSCFTSCCRNRANNNANPAAAHVKSPLLNAVTRSNYDIQQHDDVEDPSEDSSDEVSGSVDSNDSSLKLN